MTTIEDYASSPPTSLDGIWLVKSIAFRYSAPVTPYGGNRCALCWQVTPFVGVVNAEPLVWKGEGLTMPYDLCAVCFKQAEHFLSDPVMQRRLSRDYRWHGDGEGHYWLVDETKDRRDR